MKAILFVLAVVSGLQSSGAALLFHDGFDYPVGEELGESSSIANWENGKTQITVAGGSLDYTGLATSTGNRVNMEASEPSLDSVRTVAGAWKEQAFGTLYVSFILRVESIAGIGTTNEGTSLVTIDHTSNRSQLLAVNLLHDGAVRLGVVKYPSTSDTASSSAFFTTGAGANLSPDGSTTYLIVARYKWMEGTNNDEVTLWVNPGNLGATEDDANKVFANAGMDGSKSAGRLTVSRGPNVCIDELRIGKTWAEVTPKKDPSHQLLLAVGLLAVGLVAAGFWITQLRHKVKERSAALGAQIQERQKAEHQRLMEQERARIAQDLHDELGADITEVSMLATRLKSGEVGGQSHQFVEQIADKTRQMVAKLEEIVWAMNPEHDSLGALVSYFSFFADRFLSLANIKLTIDGAENAASLAVEARLRHQLFLVFKEALTNVIKHSGANEVHLTVRAENRVLHVTVADNGSGLREPNARTGTHEGIANMRRRMEKLGGQFEIIGGKNGGTTVKFSVPLDS